MGDFVVIPFQKGDISCMFENRQYILLPKIMLRARISSSFGASCKNLTRDVCVTRLCQFYLDDNISMSNFLKC